MKYRIIFLVCFCVVVSTTALGVLVYAEVREITRDQAIATIADETRHLAHGFDQIYTSIARDLETIAQTEAVSGIVRSSQNGGIDPTDGSTRDVWRHRLVQTLRAVLRSNPEYLKIRFIGLAGNGREIIRVERAGRNTVAAPDSALQELAAEPYFTFGISQPADQVAFADIGYESDSNDAGARRILTIRAMIPVDDAMGYRFGVLTISADYEALLNITMRGAEGQNFTVAINGPKDFVKHEAAAPTDRITLQLRSDPTARPSPLISKVLTRQEQEGLVEFDGMVAYFVRDSGIYSQQSAQIGFATQMPVSALLGDAEIVRGRIVSICIFAALFFSIIATVVAKRFIRPLGSLTTLISETSNEILLDALPTDRNDEIGDLARSFRQRTQALIDSEARATVIVDNVPDGLILLDETGMIEDFNPSCERIFGYKAEDIVGKHLEQLLPERMTQYDEIFRNMYDKLKKTAQPGAVRELEMMTAENGRIPVEISISALTIEDKRKYSGVIRNIADRRAIERLRSEFVATVSHELRTPLTSIRGALVLIDQLMAGPRPEKIERMLSMAQKNTTRLILLVNDILDFEKLQANKANFTLTRTDLNPEIEKSVEMNTTYAQDRKVTLKVEVSDKPLVSQVDRDRLQQVLANLISNAAKFSREGGCVTVSIEQRGKNAILSVTDEGTGIPKDFQDKVFTPFSQADTASNSNRKGTGLGLIITKRLVEGMGGKIGFRSTEGEGSTFWVSFPLVEQRKGAAAKPSGPAPARLSGLHLEDDSDFAEILQAALETEIQMVNEATLEGARQLLYQRSFDLVIVDIDLHGANGLDLIKSIPDHNATTIVVLTALDEKVDNPWVDLTLLKSKGHISDVSSRILSLMKNKTGRRAAS